METDMAQSTWHDNAVRSLQVHGSLDVARVAEECPFPPVYEDCPEAGYFLMRAAPRSKLFLPVRFYYELRGELYVSGQRIPLNPWHHWLSVAKKPIPRAEWEERVKDRQLTEVHEYDF